MPNSPDDNWSDWISALMVNLPSDGIDTAAVNQVLDRARQLLDAIDRGGIPTDPIRVNNIGRALGLDVLPSAPMADTIERIRVEVNRP